MSLTEFKKALSKTDEIELTVVGRSSGRETTRPVWFALDGDTLYLLPVTGSESAWFNSLLKNPTVRLRAGDLSVTATARPITDPARVRDVVERFRAKYGADQVEKYYSRFDAAVEVPLTV